MVAGAGLLVAALVEAVVTWKTFRGDLGAILTLRLVALGLGRVASVVPWFALIAGLWLAAAVGDAWRTRWRDAALAAALAALVIVGYRGFPRGGKVADDAYVKFVRPTVAVAPR